ncbi:CoA ester lyase [Fictibacillus sp. WQ 8-8]|uniref:HpcH/HpaI aldolase/citrate lyase family protein n=1 Tax=Fictibacillus sp. WQ 8-8 TaxID=2938788 RepID=UPI00210D8D94|nr:CoA ester lyase [Fictibacillus sp. WQ 8-8]MCQ6268376.1 CoA ester lyase [Fictibacillus sp. WQ 8-8]
MSLYRSWMFVPGSDSRKIEKTRQLEADVIIFDLEDAVAVSEKEVARTKVKQALQQYPRPYNVVRVNAANTPYFIEDVKEMVKYGAKAIMLPKSETSEQILLLKEILSNAEKEQGLDYTIDIIPLIESARGVHQVDQIAASSTRIKCLAFGSVDYALDIDGELTKEGFELLYARSRIVNVSRAIGIEQPIDAVFTDIKDREGLKKETQFVKRLGFQGKLVVHPNQIDVVNQAFVPSKEDIENAQLIISAYMESSQEGSGAVEVNGKMVDYPIVERAKRILEKAQAVSC